MNMTIVLAFPTSTISGDGLSNFLDDLYDYTDGPLDITLAHQSLTLQVDLDTDTWSMSEALHDIEQLAFVRFKGCAVTFQ